MENKIQHKIKLYSTVESVPQMYRYDLERVIEECPFIHSDHIGAIIDPYDDKKAICVFDEYDNICGFACIIVEDHGVFLSELFVEPHAQNKGRGSVLLDAVRIYAKKNGKEDIALAVAENNVLARRLYERKGYVYNSYSGKGGRAIMRRFVSSGVQNLGRVVFKLEKVFGVGNCAKGLQSIRESRDFGIFADMMISEGAEERISKTVDSKLVEAACVLQDGMKGEYDRFVVHSLKNGRYDYLLREEQSQYAQLLEYPQEVYANIALIVEAAKTCRNDDIIRETMKIEELNERKEKDGKGGK